MKYLKTFGKVLENNIITEIKGKEYLYSDDSDEYKKYDDTDEGRRKMFRDYAMNIGKREESRVEKMIDTWDENTIQDSIEKRIKVYLDCIDKRINLSILTKFLSDNLERIKHFIKNGVGTGEYQTKYGTSNILLDTIIYHYVPDLTEIGLSLIDSGVNLETHQTNNGNTALISASYYGYSEFVKKLISKNANMNAVNKNGENALCSIGVSSLWSDRNDGLIDCAKILIKNGANVNAKLESGNNVLILSANRLLDNWDYNDDDDENFKSLKNEVDFIVFLIKNGADISLENNKHRTFCDYLKSSKIMEYIISNCKGLVDKLEFKYHTSKFNI